MNSIILATRNEELNDSIASIEDLDILDRIDSSLELRESCENLNPDILIISAGLLGESFSTGIKSLVNSEFFTGRIIILFSTLDSISYKKICLAEKLGILDYIIGTIDLDYLYSLILAPINHKAEQSYLQSKRKEYNFIETVQIVEKKVIVTGKQCISLISGSSTGKSFITWALSLYLAHNKLKVGVLSLDSNNTLGVYFDIQEDVVSKITSLVMDRKYSYAVRNSFMLDNSIRVVSLPTSNTDNELEALSEIVRCLKQESDIVLIDTPTNDINTIKQSLVCSTKDVYVYDLDPCHFNKNQELLGYLDSVDSFNIIINKYSKKSRAYKSVLRGIKGSAMKIASISSIADIGSESCDLQYIDSLYEDFSKQLQTSLEELSSKLGIVKQKHRGRFFGL